MYSPVPSSFSPPLLALLLCSSLPPPSFPYLILCKIIITHFPLPSPPLIRRLLHRCSQHVHHAGRHGTPLPGGRGRTLYETHGHLSQGGHALHGRPLLQHKGRVGNRAIVDTTQQETGGRAVWRGVGRTVERNDARSGEDTQTGLHGREGLPIRGPDYEKAAARKVDPTVRRLYQGRAHIHRDGADEERESVGLPAEGRGTTPEAAGVDRRRRSGCQRDGLPGVSALHPQRSGRQKRPRRRREHREDRRFRAGPCHHRQRVHGTRGGEIPHQVDGTRGRTLQPLQHQVGHLVVWNPHL